MQLFGQRLIFHKETEEIGLAGYGLMPPVETIHRRIMNQKRSVDSHGRKTPWWKEIRQLMKTAASKSTPFFQS